MIADEGHSFIKRRIAGSVNARVDGALVLGLGNPLMGDDAVGPEALKAFEERYRLPEGVDVVDGGTQGLSLLDRVEGCEALLVADCLAVGEAPGAVVRLEGDALPSRLSPCRSPHQVGLLDLVSALGLLGRLPGRLTVLGIEPQKIAFGEGLSAPIARNLPRLVEAMAAELASWGLPPERVE